MNNIKNNLDNHICNICNKIYSSYKSLWNHNKEFHKNKNNEFNIVNTNVKIIKSLTCELCNKIFNNRPAKSIHKKNVQKNVN